MQQEKTDIKSMNLEELKSYMESIGEKPFRAKQLYQWMHEKQAASFDEMTNLSKSLQEKLKNECRFVSLKQEAVQISKIDGTRKYLFALDDGNVIESVLMRYKHGNSVCISSQVGCRMGCRFCASTLDGLVRGLTPSEMLDQIYRITRDTGERVANVVVMGTGEPMDNFDNLLKFIELLTDENGLNISQRNVTVSTCGIVPKMRELAAAQLAGKRKFADGQRLYIAGLMRMQPNKAWASDANFTLRLTYGRVLPYDPADGIHYNYYTTLKGVMEKENPQNPTEFTVPARLKELYAAKDFGRYANERGELPVAFLADCDITGGNSGSPVLNAKGTLLGLAFDGNWEAMSGDVAFEPELQRTIAVDVRYVLFVIDKFAGAGWLLDELQFE